jgi:hypothetical protein
MLYAAALGLCFDDAAESARQPGDTANAPKKAD